MARTITEIKNEMTFEFIKDETVINSYGLDGDKTFDQQFSRASIESLFFYIMAFCIWTLECLFDAHSRELTELIDSKKPHRPKWYRDKALSFRFDRLLIPGDDVYELDGIDLQAIEGELVVKYASARDYAGRVFVKVAGGSGTEKQKLTEEEEISLRDYFSQIKDAGVVVELVNKEAVHFRCEIVVYYSPLAFNEHGMRLSTGAFVVHDAVRDYVQNQIPFNGEYRNVELIDVLQKIDGVVIPELRSACFFSDQSYDEGGIWTGISARCTPASGYFKIYEETDLVLNFKAYSQNAE
jgi:hypothetical protein